MSLILIASGFKHLESLQEFSTRYPCISHNLDGDLENIWICHKNFQDIPEYEDNFQLEVENYIDKIKKKIDSAQKFISLQNKFEVTSLFNKIYCHFKGYLTIYIFMKCYMFYNWGINSFEPVFDHVKIHEKIEKNMKNFSERKKKKIPSEKNVGNVFLEEVEPKQNECTLNHGKTEREGSVDLFDEPKVVSDCLPTKTVSWKSFQTQNSEPFLDLPKNLNDPSQETFNLNQILYDMKQKPQWPANHVLSGNDGDKLLLFIIEMQVGSNVLTKNKLKNECKNWVKLKNLLRMIMRNHVAVEKNNGYGRILKRHLKKVTTTPGLRLNPIRKSIVSSYILDIIRRVLPLELFGCNRLRKKFYSSIIRILSGSKNESFIWHPLLRFFFESKSEIPWCAEMSDSYTQTQMILKIFKFIIIHYVFVILRNNFYVTETGTSGFGLRFYRKSDIESASFACSNRLFRDKHMRNLKKSDFKSFTIERKWVDTGVIDGLSKNSKIMMDPNSEFKQAIASIRFLPKNDWSDDMRIITKMTRKPSCSKSVPEGVGLEKVFKSRVACREKKLFWVKLLLEFLVDIVEFGIKPVPNNPKLEAAWNKAIYLKENFGKLYFVKADIADAFGSVKHSVLTEIIQEILANEFTNQSIRLKKITEWKKTKWKLKKVSRLSFCDRPRENSVLLTRSICVPENKKTKDEWNVELCLENSRNVNFLNIIKQVAMQQKIEMKGRVLKLVQGLAQGSAGKFSSQLCEIYYSWMDRFYFKDFINSKTVVFLRGVDDYLLVTPHREKAEEFLKIVGAGINDFNAKFNNDKLKSNLLENVDEVSYLGLIFNFDDMSVKPNYSKFLLKDLLSTMKLSDARDYIHFKKVHFLERRSLNINSLKLQRIFLDKNHNNLKTVRQVVFQACLMQSLRVMALAKYLFPGKTKNDLFLSKVLFKSCNKIKNRVSNSSELSKEECHWLFLFAVLCIFQKFPGQFKYLFVIIRYKLEKCERIFINTGSELLLELLQNDLYEEKFWKEIYEIFGKLAANTKPFSLKTLK